MDEIARLGLAVDATQVQQASKSLEELALAGKSAEAATTSLARSSGRMASSYSMQAQATAEVSARTFEASSQVQRLMDRYDPLGTKLRALESDFAALNEAASSGQLGSNYDVAVDKTYASLNAEIAQTKQLMADAGAAVDGGSESLDNLSFSSGNARRQLMMLGRDVMSGNVHNIPNRLSMIAIQSNAIALALTPIGGAVLGITAALGAGGYAWYKWSGSADEALEKMQKSLSDRVVSAMDVAAETKRMNAKEQIAEMEKQIKELEDAATRIENRAKMAQRETVGFDSKGQLTSGNRNSIKSQLIATEEAAVDEALVNMRRNLKDARKSAFTGSPEEASKKFVEQLEKELYAVGKTTEELKRREIALMKLPPAERAYADALLTHIILGSKDRLQREEALAASAETLKSILTEIGAEEERAAAIGKTEKELRALEQAALAESAASLDRQASLRAAINANDEIATLYRVQASALRDLAKAKGETNSKLDTAIITDKAVEDAKQMKASVEGIISDATLYALEGKFDSIGDMFKQLMLRMAADAAAAKLTNALFGGSGGNGASPLTDASGNEIAGPQQPSPAAMAGAALGAAMPYVAAAYAVATIGFGIGNKRENVGGNRLVGDFAKGKDFVGNRQQDWELDGGVFGGDSSGTYISEVTRAELALFREVTQNLQFAFYEFGDAVGYSAVRTVDWSTKINAAGDITGKLADGIGEDLLPSLEKFRVMGENLAETAARLTTVFQTSNEFILSLGISSEQAFGAIGVASLESRKKLIDAAGGIEVFGRNSAIFIDAFLTDSEKLQPSLDAVGRAFSQLGITGVSTNEQFAALVKSYTELGKFDVVAQLLSVAGAFDEITKSAKALVSKDSFGSLGAYLVASGSSNVADLIDTAKAEADIKLPIESDANASQLRKDKKEEARLKWQAELKKWTDFRGSYNGNNDALGDAARELADKMLNGAVKNLEKKYLDLPSFATGNPFVAQNMTANIHKGEMIVDADSAGLMRRYGIGSGNTALVAELRALRKEVAGLRSEAQAAQVAIATNTNRSAKILERFDGNGLPAEREL